MAVAGTNGACYVVHVLPDQRRAAMGNPSQLVAFPVNLFQILGVWSRSRAKHMAATVKIDIHSNNFKSVTR